MQKGLNSNFYNCICNDHSQLVLDINEVIQCQICDLYSHKKCFPYLKMEKDEFICPSCQLDFLNPLVRIQKILLPPTFLKKSDKNHKIEQNQANKISDLMNNFNNINLNELLMQSKNIKEAQNEENKFTFDLLPYFREFRDNDYYLVIYCLKLDNKGFKNEWPENSTIIINGNKNFLLGAVNKLEIENKNMPIIFPSDLSLTTDDYINVINNRFMKRNLTRSFMDYFTIGQNQIEILLPPKTDFKNNLYCICIRTEFLMSTRYVYLTFLKNSYVIYYERNKNKKQLVEINSDKELRKKFENYDKFKTKGIFCKHFECFELLNILEKYDETGGPMICHICDEIIGAFRLVQNEKDY